MYLVHFLFLIRVFRFTLFEFLPYVYQKNVVTSDADTGFIYTSQSESIGDVNALYFYNE